MKIINSKSEYRNSKFTSLRLARIRNSNGGMFQTCMLPIFCAKRIGEAFWSFEFLSFGIFFEFGASIFEFSFDKQPCVALLGASSYHQFSDCVAIAF